MTIKCDVCGRELQPAPPEVEKQRRAEAVARGIPLEQQKYIVCDPCWDAHETFKAHEPFFRLRKIGQA